MTQVETHCPYCALQCGMSLEGTRVTPRDFPVNAGGLCQKGWTSGSLLTSPRRLTTPMLRVNGALEPVSWDFALDHVARKLAEIQGEHGPDGVAIFGGGGLTNEKAYLLGKFARVALGTSQIDYNGRFCMSSAAAAGIKAFGADRGMPFPVTDLKNADVVLLAGANPAETMPPFTQHLRGTDLIVVDPRRTPTAELASLHLAPAPGTDLALALGILHAVVESGHLDRSYVDDRTSGFAEMWRIAASWWPERAERVTGVSAADMRLAAEKLAAARNAYVLTARGTEQHATGTATVGAWINLALSLGLPGRPGSGYGCLTGQGNGQGGREHGQKADQLPGYRKLDDPAAREYVASVWGVDADSLPGPGRSATELLEALGQENGPKALMVFGSNVVVSAPRSQRVQDRLSGLDFLVVADFVLSETAALADVVLPVTQWAEEDGTLTNLEGRVLLRRKALTPPPGVRSDLDVLNGLALRLGQPENRFPADAETVFEELRIASKGGIADYSGVSYDRLRAGEALHWPVPADDHPGTPRMFLESFAHPDGRARFVPVEHTGPAELPDDEFPLQATTGRVLQHYQSGAQTRLIGELNDVVPEVFVEVHPDTAKRAGLEEGDRAVVRSRRGETVARVRFTQSLKPDLIFLPFHFPGEQRANLFTNPALDPVSRMPEFKVCAVSLSTVDGAA
ncbi:nitrate reductase catalytic subunit [Amycolatopsis mediterranei S699]|uniref:Nitrate reductase catalytic subunit n=5 Tax=Amycolatopsis mediterranei TaxID=33910 RepID=A0A0H3D089_AMYMU|nr:molybdopterin oxidoreductase family protein [Amycolatopsis mediterranei]AAK77359.1 nitrate reductase catalytic subunit [Amycolatopsis mediterranei U32]ADJ42936.1 nitrate reductase catalytic subunit [Amycolatopsis mediterranei U32]AEK39631.1 nitrate reductase catalytic subunit [Amycolatopsis mediterranei S699]AFO74650.1 nitrate reductase catalytic subunit [Amycolatopsis mediterranei S699]AGT81779.1 nitrate reductase catalytic subunit [Amycolatopsis mediterranei RB]